MLAPLGKMASRALKGLFLLYTSASCKQSTILADFDGFRINYDHDDNSNVGASCAAAQVFLRFMLKSSKDLISEQNMALSKFSTSIVS